MDAVGASTWAGADRTVRADAGKQPLSARVVRAGSPHVPIRTERLSAPRAGYSSPMSDDINAPDVVDNEVTDVLAEDEVVQVPPAAADLAESLDHPGST